MNLQNWGDGGGCLEPLLPEGCPQGSHSRAAARSETGWDPDHSSVYTKLGTRAEMIGLRLKTPSLAPRLNMEEN